AAPPPSGAVAPVFPAPPLAARVSEAIEPALPWLVILWFGGVLVMSLRLASGWLAVRRLWTEGTRPVPESCSQAVARLAARLGVAAPRLALAAGGGSLVGRIQRLVVPAQVETFPRWIAGLVVAALALAIGGGTGLASRTERFEARTHLSPSVVGADAGQTAPD